MITLPTSWLYQGKKFRNLVRLNTLDKDSLFHSFLTCVYRHYRTKKLLQDKYLYVSRFKISLINYKKDYDKIIREDDEDNFLKMISQDFEINIYLMRCKSDDTIIKESYIFSDDSPTILIEKCDFYYPLGIEQDGGIHTMFFDGIDNEVITCLEIYDKSEISNSEDVVGEEFRIDDSKYLKYNVQKIFKKFKA